MHTTHTSYPADRVFVSFCFWCRRGLSADPVESSRREDADANLPDSKVAYIARSKRDVAEYFGVAWSTMQPRLVGKIGTKVKEHAVF